MNNNNHLKHAEQAPDSANSEPHQTASIDFVSEQMHGKPMHHRGTISDVEIETLSAVTMDYRTHELECEKTMVNQ